MARYLARSCPRCNGYIGIIMRDPGRNVPLKRSTGLEVRLSHVVDRDSRTTGIPPEWATPEQRAQAANKYRALNDENKKHASGLTFI